MTWVIWMWMIGSGYVLCMRFWIGVMCMWCRCGCGCVNLWCVWIGVRLCDEETQGQTPLCPCKDEIQDLDHSNDNVIWRERGLSPTLTNVHASTTMASWHMTGHGNITHHHTHTLAITARHRHIPTHVHYAASWYTGCTGPHIAHWHTRIHSDTRHWHTYGHCVASLPGTRVKMIVCGDSENGCRNDWGVMVIGLWVIMGLQLIGLWGWLVTPNAQSNQSPNNHKITACPNFSRFDGQ